MVLFHLAYNLVYMQDIPLAFFQGIGGEIWGFLIRLTFIVISGISFNFSKNKLKHGLKLGLAALVISLASYIFDRQFFIKFGIIHFLALASLITIFVDRLLNKSYAKILFPLAIALFSFSFVFLNRDFDIGTNLFAFVGFYNSNFSSADFFPLIPWYFLYLTGYLSYYIFDYKKISSTESPLSKLGRKSLLIYLIHQPILIILIEIFKKII